MLLTKNELLSIVIWLLFGRDISGALEIRILLIYRKYFLQWKSRDCSDKHVYLCFCIFPYFASCINNCVGCESLNSACRFEPPEEVPGKEFICHYIACCNHHHLIARNVVDIVFYVLNVIFQSAVIHYSCAVKFYFHWLGIINWLTFIDFWIF